MMQGAANNLAASRMFTERRMFIEQRSNDHSPAGRYDIAAASQSRNDTFNLKFPPSLCIDLAQPVIFWKNALSLRRHACCRLA